MRKRIVMTGARYKELTEARDWCHLNGLPGFKRWYDEELAFQASRYALPPGAAEYREADERPERGRRDRSDG